MMQDLDRKREIIRQMLRTGITVQHPSLTAEDISILEKHGVLRPTSSKEIPREVREQYRKVCLSIYSLRPFDTGLSSVPNVGTVRISTHSQSSQMNDLVWSSQRIITPGPAPFPDTTSDMADPAVHSATIQFADTLSDDHDLSIPLDAESLEALVWIGMTRAAAKDSWRRWSECFDGPYDFIEFVDGGFCGPYMTEYKPPWWFLDRWGIDTRMKEAILDAKFSDIFNTKSLSYWVFHSIHSNFAALENMLERLREIASFYRHTEANQIHQNDWSGRRYHPKASSSNPDHPSTHIYSRSFFGWRPEPPTTREKNSKNFSDLGTEYLTLYRGNSLENEQNSHGYFHPEGKLDLRTLERGRTSDFHVFPVTCKTYWTPNKAAAEKTRAWAAKRAWCANSYLLEIKVEVKWLNTLKIHRFTFGDEWKEYVESCRDDCVPRKFKRIRDADLIRGPVYADNSKRPDIENPKARSKRGKKSFVWKLDGADVEQYMIRAVSLRGGRRWDFVDQTRHNVHFTVRDALIIMDAK